MSKSRPSYSNEFKNNAANLVLDQQYSVNDACKAVGVGYTALRRWVAQLDAERGGITPSARAITPEHCRIQELEARIKQIEWDIGILTKAWYGIPGAITISAKLTQRGELVGRYKAASLMQEANLVSKQLRKHRYKIVSDVSKITPNILQRNFNVVLPNTAWCGDVT